MIDIIIPAYNCSKTLGRTLSSLVSQTDTNFLVTIVDDCSTEDIKHIVEDYSSKLNIKYIRNKENLGCGMSRQVGIDNTECTHFTFLDSDDVFMPYAVETFNTILLAHPETEYVHSHFYEQTKVNGYSALILHDDGYTWCHGKLYNRSLINKFGIKNSPLIKWADDSYFNSMCSELLQMRIIALPLYLWCNNRDSVTRKVDPEREKLKKEDFLTAMNMSKQFVLQFKDSISHMDLTLKKLDKIDPSLNDKEAELLKQIQER